MIDLSFRKAHIRSTRLFWKLYHRQLKTKMNCFVAILRLYELAQLCTGRQAFSVYTEILPSLVH